METRASKHVSDAETPPPASSATEDQSQNTPGPFSSPKKEDLSPLIKSEFPQLSLSAEEFSIVMAMRSSPTTENTFVPSLASLLHDLGTPPKVYSEKLEAPTPPNSNPPTADTAILLHTSATKTPTITARETRCFDLQKLEKEKFTLSSTLNKPRFEQLDRILKGNELYTMAIEERTRPRHTTSNPAGYSPIIYDPNGIDVILADDITNYRHDLERLGSCIYAAFDKSLYHQSQGFITNDPIMMYRDLRTYFYGRDNNGINAARNALAKFHITPSFSLKADITLFEEVLKNVEYASGEIITENIRLSIVDEKFGLDMRQGVRERLTHWAHSSPTQQRWMRLRILPTHQ